MGFVLSAIRPPEGEAKYGKATTFEPLPERKNLHTPAYRMLRKYNPHMDSGMASRYSEQVSAKECGREVVEASTGLIFRVDKAEDAPHGGQGIPGVGRG